MQHVVVGIGVNLRRTAYDPALAGRAISIEDLTGRGIDRHAVLAEVLEALATWREHVRHAGTGALLDAWRARAPSSRGARVWWNQGATRHSGETAGIGDDGALLVRTPAGVERIVAGEINWE